MYEVPRNPLRSFRLSLCTALTSMLVVATGELRQLWLLISLMNGDLFHKCISSSRLHSSSRQVSADSYVAELSDEVRRLRGELARLRKVG